MKAGRGAAYRLSALVALVLAVLTGIEYVVALYFAEIPDQSGLVFLILLALLKAVAVVYYFMHINRLWSTDEH